MLRLGNKYTMHHVQNTTVVKTHYAIMNSNEEQITSKENQDTNIKCDYTETLC